MTPCTAEQAKARTHVLHALGGDSAKYEASVAKLRSIAQGRLRADTTAAEAEATLLALGEPTGLEDGRAHIERHMGTRAVAQGIASKGNSVEFGVMTAEEAKAFVDARAKGG